MTPTRAWARAARRCAAIFSALIQQEATPSSDGQAGAAAVGRARRCRRR